MRRVWPWLLLAVSLAACRGRSLPSSVTDPIRIGVVLPQTGLLGTDGQAWVRGVRLAADEVNAAGGLLGGRRVELVVADSATAMDAAVGGANSVIGQGAVAVIGDGGSGGSLAIYQGVTQPMMVPQLSGSATSTSLTMANSMLPASERFFFRTAPPDAYQAQVVVRIAQMNAHCTSLAIMNQNDAYGMPFADAIARLYTAAGGTVAVRVPFTPASPSYTSEVQMIASATPTPDCIALIAYPTDAGLILRAWENLGASRPMVHWIGTDGLFSADFIHEAGSDARVQGFLGATPLTTPMTPEFTDFAARYQTVYGHAPENFVANYYDATALLLLAIERAGSTDGAAIRDALREIGGPTGTTVERAAALQHALATLHAGGTAHVNYEGASGPIDFDANGDTVGPYEIWQITGTPAAFQQVAVVQPTDLMMLP
jgi:ABC-type branched-subunit amino acid transport system substrate-binding protein